MHSLWIAQSEAGPVPIYDSAVMHEGTSCLAVKDAIHEAEATVDTTQTLELVLVETPLSAYEEVSTPMETFEAEAEASSGSCDDGDSVTLQLGGPNGFTVFYQGQLRGTPPAAYFELENLFQELQQDAYDATGNEVFSGTPQFVTE